MGGGGSKSGGGGERRRDNKVANFVVCCMREQDALLNSGLSRRSVPSHSNSEAAKMSTSPQTPTPPPPTHTHTLPQSPPPTRVPWYQFREVSRTTRKELGCLFFTPSQQGRLYQANNRLHNGSARLASTQLCT